MAGGDVTITINDGGANTAINVPASNVRVKLGCLLTAVGQTAVVNQIIATTNAGALATAFVGGALKEAAGLVVAAGAVVLAIGMPVAADGTATAVVDGAGNTSTSNVTVTLDATNGAWDDFYVLLRIVRGGTVGTAGIQLQISLDAGRTFGPLLALGTAVTYAIPSTGVTLNFDVGTLVTGDTFRFATTAPMWDASGLNAAIAALQASPYALSGWGGMHAVGVSTSSLAATAQTALGGSPDGTGGLAGDYVWTRMIMDARDAIAPTAWGGAGETEATWLASVTGAFAATSAKRVGVAAGYYNMPSAFPNPAAGTPSYRRPLGWAWDVRQAVIPPQRHAGRVRDGSLGNITINPTTDPTDGFIYHDERITPGFTGARFCAAKTRSRRQGYFIDQPNLMSPTGSTFTLLPFGNVIDVACDITFQSASTEINDDLRLNANGTLYVTDRLALEGQIDSAIQANMTSINMISGQTVTVDPLANVGATSNVPIDVSIQRNGYILSETINIGFAAPSAAGG